MRKHKQGLTGFTLIELMLVIAIIGILSVFAIPSYLNYTLRMHATEMLNGAAHMKSSVAVCLTGGNIDCSSGQNSVMTTQTLTKTLTDSFQIDSTVTVTGASINPNTNILVSIPSGHSKGGLPANAQILLTPRLDVNNISWIVSCLGDNNTDWCPLT